MNQLVTIHQQQVERVLYQAQPVVTLRMLDQIHERPAGTAGRNFRENRERFVAGVDYFEVPYQEWKHLLPDQNSDALEIFEDMENFDGTNSVPSKDSETTKFVVSESARKGGRRGSMIFLTEIGYLLLVKSFTDDLAWQIQRELVSAYFRVKSPAQPQAQLAAADPEPPGEYHQGLYYAKDHVYYKLTKDQAIKDGWRNIGERDQTNKLLQKYITLLEEKVQRLETEQKTRKPVSPEQEQQIVTLTAQGYSAREIAEALDRNIDTIRTVLYRHKHQS